MNGTDAIKAAFVGKWVEPPVGQNRKDFFNDPANGKWQRAYEIKDAAVFAEGSGCCCHRVDPFPYFYLYHEIEGRKGLFGILYRFSEEVIIVGPPVNSPLNLMKGRDERVV